MTELLLGCGSSRVKKLWKGGSDWDSLTTLDNNADHRPDIEWDLAEMPLPFGDATFDEIHAYEVLEHVGAQGDWRFFFDQWAEFWRLLKPAGHFFGTVPLPSSPWAWGDPSHTRVIPKEALTFLSQANYEKHVGVTPMSDFRFYYRADFEPLHLRETEHNLEFVLRAIK